MKRILFLLILFTLPLEAQTLIYEGKALGATLVNCNSAATDVATITVPFPKYKVVSVTFYDASLSVTTATIGVFTAAGGGGTSVLAASVLTALTAATKITSPALTLTTDYLTSSSLFIRNVTAQGGACTLSVKIELQPLQ